MLKKPKKFEVRKLKYVTNLWMWSSWWGFSEGYLSIDTIDTFAKESILYQYLFSSILPITIRKLSVQNLHHAWSTRLLADHVWSWPHTRLHKCVQAFMIFHFPVTYTKISIVIYFSVLNNLSLTQFFYLMVKKKGINNETTLIM